MYCDILTYCDTLTNCKLKGSKGEQCSNVVITLSGLFQLVLSPIVVLGLDDVSRVSPVGSIGYSSFIQDYMFGGGGGGEKIKKKKGGEKKTSQGGGGG